MTEVISSNLLQNILLPTISLRYNPGAYSESFKISKWQWFGGYWKKTKNPVAVDGTLFLKILYKGKKERNSDIRDLICTGIMCGERLHLSSFAQLWEAPVIITINRDVNGGVEMEPQRGWVRS